MVFFWSDMVQMIIQNNQFMANAKIIGLLETLGEETMVKMDTLNSVPMELETKIHQKEHALSTNILSILQWT